MGKRADSGCCPWLLSKLLDCSCFCKGNRKKEKDRFNEKESLLKEKTGRVSNESVRGKTGLGKKPASLLPLVQEQQKQNFTYIYSYWSRSSFGDSESGVFGFDLPGGNKSKGGGVRFSKLKEFIVEKGHYESKTDPELLFTPMYNASFSYGFMVKIKTDVAGKLGDAPSIKEDDIEDIQLTCQDYELFRGGVERFLPESKLETINPNL